jgi:hypothetical protein
MFDSTFAALALWICQFSNYIGARGLGRGAANIRPVGGRERYDETKYYRVSGGQATSTAKSGA